MSRLINIPNSNLIKHFGVLSNCNTGYTKNGNQEFYQIKFLEVVEDYFRDSSNSSTTHTGGFVKCHKNSYFIPQLPTSCYSQLLVTLAPTAVNQTGATQSCLLQSGTAIASDPMH
ncbi:hypothetical protein RRG12_39980 [Nostoc sp. CALU 546]